MINPNIISVNLDSNLTCHYCGQIAPENSKSCGECCYSVCQICFSQQFQPNENNMCFNPKTNCFTFLSEYELMTKTFLKNISKELVKCKCDQSIQFPYNLLSQHKETCDLEPVQCQYCRLYFERQKLKKHIEITCGQAPENCEKCNLIVLRDQMPVHQQQECLQRDFECIKCTYKNVESNKNHDCFEVVKNKLVSVTNTAFILSQQLEELKQNFQEQISKTKEIKDELCELKQNTVNQYDSQNHRTGKWIEEKRRTVADKVIMNYQNDILEGQQECDQLSFNVINGNFDGEIEIDDFVKLYKSDFSHIFKSNKNYETILKRSKFLSKQNGGYSEKFLFEKGNLQTQYSKQVVRGNLKLLIVNGLFDGEIELGDFVSFYQGGYENIFKSIQQFQNLFDRWNYVKNDSKFSEKLVFKDGIMQMQETKMIVFTNFNICVNNGFFDGEIELKDFCYLHQNGFIDIFKLSKRELEEKTKCWEGVKKIWAKSSSEFSQKLIFRNGIPQKQKSQSIIFNSNHQINLINGFIEGKISASCFRMIQNTHNHIFKPMDDKSQTNFDMFTKKVCSLVLEFREGSWVQSSEWLEGEVGLVAGHYMIYQVTDLDLFTRYFRQVTMSKRYCSDQKPVYWSQFEYMLSSDMSVRYRFKVPYYFKKELQTTFVEIKVMSWDQNKSPDELFMTEIIKKFNQLKENGQLQV